MLIGLQTFTIRRIFQSENDIEKTLKNLKTMGINYLELAYFPFKMEKIKILKKYLEIYQIKVISSQIKYQTIINNFSEIMEIHQELNIRYIAISVIPFRRLFLGKYGLKKLANELNTLGERIEAYNIELLFHHHNYEFIKFNNKMAFDLLLKHLDPKKVKILSDTYWVKKGGFEVLAFLDKYKEYVKALHLRGYHNDSDSNFFDSDISLAQVIEYGKNNDFYYAVIEQNTKDELNEISKSVGYIKEAGYLDLLEEKTDV